MSQMPGMRFLYYTFVININLNRCADYKNLTNHLPAKKISAIPDLLVSSLYTLRKNPEELVLHKFRGVSTSFY